MKNKWVVRDDNDMGFYFMSEDKKHECLWVTRLKLARRYYIRAHAQAAAAKWGGVVVRLVPRRKS